MTSRRAIAPRLRVKLRRAWRKRRFSASVACSLAFHGALIALLFLTFTSVAPGPALRTLLVDLVQIGTEGETSGTTTGETPDQPSTAKAAAATPAPHTGGVTRTGETKPDNVGDLLRLAEVAHGQPAYAAPHPGGGAVAVGSGAEGTRGGGGHTGLKDFIRAQIERRWQVDARAGEMIVSVHLIIAPDGSVTSAEVIGSIEGTPAYRATMLGARNAALLSSPLQFPPGLEAGVSDLTIDLDTKDAKG